MDRHRSRRGVGCLVATLLVGIAVALPAAGGGVVLGEGEVT